jgi:hypothetical protein
VDYHTPAALEAFADGRRRAYAGQCLPVDRLVGFCLLTRREVLQAVGGLDEGFGLGFFEDDDWCVRVREAGFRLLVALDVFVHHYGSRTFAGLGVDLHAQLQANFDRFKAKWGEARAVGYRLPDATLPRAEGPRVVWEGPQQTVHSFAHVNRQLCAALRARGHDVVLLPTDEVTGPAPLAADPADVRVPAVAARLHPARSRPLGRHAALGVRQPPRRLGRATGHRGRRGLGA